MKYIASTTFKILLNDYFEELKTKGLKFADSKEFKQSDYHDYTALDLLEAINNEDHEEKRAVLVCMLHYKLEHFMYQSTAERRHFEKFKQGFTN